MGAVVANPIEDPLQPPAVTGHLLGSAPPVICTGAEPGGGGGGGGGDGGGGGGGGWRRRGRGGTGAGRSGYGWRQSAGAEQPANDARLAAGTCARNEPG